MTSTITRLSAEEFLGRDDWPDGAELIDGEVVVTDPTFEHQEIAAIVVEALRSWVRSGDARGRAGYGGNWVLGDGQTYKPDAWWVREERRAAVKGARSDAPPDLAVEVRSPKTWHLDIGPKRATYERSGVTELWLVDPPARTVIVARRTTEETVAFDVTFEVGPGETLTTPLLPELRIAVDDLFA